jgi:predicted alpha/beta-hydrolase family hydrolase
VSVHILLGHGASGSAESMRPWIAGLRRRGLDGETVPRSGKLPMKAERAMELFREAAGDGRQTVLGGQSYGGRVASMLAAEGTGAGLLLLSYPLHRPGHPDELRTDHWPNIRCPVLLLSGESDPFARLDLLQESVRLLPHAHLHTYPGVGHGLSRVMNDALDRAAEWLSANF